MKTSNKLLLGLLFVFLIFATVLIIVSANRFHRFENPVLTGKQSTQVRTLPAFNEIEIAGKFQLNYTQGSTQSVFVQADSSLLKDIVTEVHGNRLRIRLIRNFYSGDYIRVNVTSEALSELEISAGGIFKTTNCLKSPDLMVSASAGTILEVNGEITNLKADLSAGCMARFLGTCDNMQLDASAGCIINADSLYTKTANIEASAGTIAKLNVSQEISVSASAGSNITYKGNPKLKTVDISGGAVFQHN